MQKNNQKKCILIYEDDIEILQLCKTILMMSNYRVETLSICKNVIKDIEYFKPDLILMDLWIPEIGGEKAISIIKKNTSTQNIPVILFSANSDIQEICKKINADGYIEKPFDINLLKSTIELNISN
jgi:DNA-binding response OmpR family regulator